METAINNNHSSELYDRGNDGSALSGMADELLKDARSNTKESASLRIPAVALSSLGAGVSSLIPALQTVTTTTTINTDGLYRVANAAAGDALKMAKDQNYWGAMKTAAGTSKMAKFQAVDAIHATTSTTAAFNPATIMIAAALYSIDKKLDRIEATQQQMLRGMENDKNARIEADVEQLMSVIAKYKDNWDNDRFMTSNYKLVNDIQRSARAEMLSYQKSLDDSLMPKQLLVNQEMIQKKTTSLLNQFRYYRLSLFSFAMASLLEIMISGNFKEGYINGVRREIEQMSLTYRHKFSQCSAYLEKMSASSIEHNVMKGLGKASEATGKLIGAIPWIEKGPVDEFLQDNGSNLEKNAHGMVQKVLSDFSMISSPETVMFTDEMDNICKIYNHTSSIQIDSDGIRLVSAA